MEFFATCPAGFEHILANELQALKTPGIRPLQGQVAFTGSLADAYRVCLWSRLASRVVLVLDRFVAGSSHELYAGTLNVEWESHLLPNSTYSIDASGTNNQLKDTRFVALRAKDAVADRLAAHGIRAATDPKNPDVRIAVRVSRGHATIGIDLAGSPLFNRSYERRSSSKGLRPDYAAALVALGEWSAEYIPQNPAFLALASYPDPLLVEAALVAAHHAPGLSRARWGFSKWAQHDEEAWQELLHEAQLAKRQDITCAFAYRSFSKGVSRAKNTLRTLGINAEIHPFIHAEDVQGKSTLLCADLSDLRQHEMAKETSWLQILAQMAQDSKPRNLCVAARDKLSEAYLNCQSSSATTSMLGRDPLELLAFKDLGEQKPLTTVEISQGVHVPVLVPASEQFAARLKKVAKARAKWARREDVSCYRIYDSDLPDYAVTLDLFQGTNPTTGELDGRRWLQIYEYAAPKGVDETLARSRLMDVLAIAPQILGVAGEDTFLRVRKRDRGGSQYASETQSVQPPYRQRKDGRVTPPEGAHLIDEGGLVFEVNFQSRMDCGIFLDHRDTRGMLREMAKQTKGSKRFLNLFAYTGTATCYAADGGMKYTTTVDLSRPSLDWARRNMARNGFTGREHEYVQADVVSWISEQRRTKNRWDLVFCDVPTFSNSNRMGKRSFDVQRDHAELLIGVSRLLTRNGTCVFSCNLRTFRPDEAALAKAGVTIEDITSQTIPEDFQRNKRIHHAYLVKRVPMESWPSAAMLVERSANN